MVLRLIPAKGLGATSSFNSFFLADACFIFFFTWIFCFCAKKDVTRFFVKKVPPTGFAVMLIRGFL